MQAAIEGQFDLASKENKRIGKAFRRAFTFVDQAYSALPDGAIYDIDSNYDVQEARTVLGFIVSYLDRMADDYDAPWSFEHGRPPKGLVPR